MNKETIYNQLLQFFEDNDNIFTEVIEELDSWDGYLGEDRYYCMEDLNEFYCNTEPLDILYRAFYGHEEGSDAEFNPNRDYFKYNGYGNLVSTDYKDYSDHLDSYFIDELVEEWDNLTYAHEYPEICELIDLLQELDEEEEDGIE